MSDSFFSDSKTPPKPPNCLKCAYFRIIWDPRFPQSCARSCDLFSISCLSMPSAEVFRATQANCPSFKLKDGLKQ